MNNILFGWQHRVNILELYMNHIIVHKLLRYIGEEAEVRICD